MKLSGIAAFTVTLSSTLLAFSGEFAPLPHAITSFGACADDEYVYVYGGHSGEAHQYSVDTTRFELLRAKLDGTTSWEEMPGPARSQGASLVHWNGELIRVGGLTAGNETVAEAEVLNSLDEVAAFDTITQRWSDLPAMPGRRSSHDAVVVGGTLFVLGGWELSGDRNGTWLNETWWLDLNHPDSGWQRINQPFTRRAVAAERVGNEIVVMGGMDEENYTSLEVDIYNVDTGRWSKGPRLPDGPMDGFGAAACVIGDTLYASTYSGKVFAWQSGDAQWTEVATPKQRRFFHRMVPASDNSLLLIGGASRDEGHLASAEIVELEPLAD